MQVFRNAAAIGVILMTGAPAYAQTQSRPQPQTPPATAEAPPGRMMGGPGRGGMGMGAQNTFGWSMMTSAERQEHMAKMRGFTTRKECEAYIADHHRLMAERARRRGASMPAEPHMNPCAGLS
jgi:hypothetical protein